MKEGLEKAVAILTQMRDAFVHENFSYDPETNVWETRNEAKLSCEEAFDNAISALNKNLCEQFGHKLQEWSPVSKRCSRCETMFSNVEIESSVIPLAKDNEERVFNFDVLKLPFKATDWVDADERMFHACFTILGQFVEDELGSEAKLKAELTPEELVDITFYCDYRLHAVGGYNEKAIDLWLWYKDDLEHLEQAVADDIREAFSGKLRTKAIPGSSLKQIVDFGKVRDPKFPHDHVANIKKQKLAELLEIRQTLWT